MSAIEGRRPIGARDSKWARAIARRLAKSSITPNQISIASIGFAAIAGIAFWGVGVADAPLRAALYLIGALACQGRLLCNLFDGMVAIEGGKSSKDGPFWNEFPDRLADVLIFVGAGYGAAVAALGWAAAAMAILTAYVRELGRANGAPADYSGPMAKQHRMAVITGAAAIAVFEPFWSGDGEVMALALVIVALGALITVVLRAIRLVRALKGRDTPS